MTTNDTIQLAATARLRRTERVHLIGAALPKAMEMSVQRNAGLAIDPKNATATFNPVAAAHFAIATADAILGTLDAEERAREEGQ